MILADVRSRLTRDDAALALALVAQQGADARDRGETALREQGLDALLDDPALLSSLLETPRGAHASLPLLAYVVVRQALVASGERDRVLADYAASVLLHFGLRDRAHKVADAEARLRLGAAAPEQAKRFSPDRMVGAVLDVYRDVLERSGV